MEGVGVSVTVDVRVGSGVDVSVGVWVGREVEVVVTVEVAVAVSLGLKREMLGVLGFVNQKIKIPDPTIKNKAAIPKINGALCARL